MNRTYRVVERIFFPLTFICVCVCVCEVTEMWMEEMRLGVVFFFKQKFYEESVIIWNSPGKNTGVGCHFLLQGIFLTQGSNPGLPHCRHDFSPAEPLGKLGSVVVKVLITMLLISTRNLSTVPLSAQFSLPSLRV